MPAVYSGMQAFFSGLIPMDRCLNELRVLQLAEFLHHISVLIAVHSPAQLDYSQLCSQTPFRTSVVQTDLDSVCLFYLLYTVFDYCVVAHGV